MISEKTQDGILVHEKYANTVSSSRVMTVLSLKYVPFNELKLNDDGSPKTWRGDWRVYISSVPGIRHEAEWRAVLDRGDKASKGFAEYKWGSLVNGILLEAGYTQEFLDKYPHNYDG